MAPLTLLPLLLSLLPGTSAAATQPAVDLNQNAAIYYQQAIAELARLDSRLKTSGSQGEGFRSEIDRIARTWRTEVTAEDQEQFVGWTSEVIRLVHAGSAISNCSWGDLEQDSRFILHRRLFPTRRLAEITSCRADYCFAHRDASGALDDLLAVLRMSHHVNQDLLIRTIHIGVSCEDVAMGVLSRHLPELASYDLDRLELELQSLPPAPSVSDNLQVEKYLLITHIVEELIKSNRDASLAQIRQYPFLYSKIPDDWPEASGVKHNLSLHDLLSSLQQKEQAFEEAAQIADLPFPKSLKAARDFDQKARTQPQSLHLGLRSMILRADIFAARRAMLRAAIAYLREGEPALQRIQDPFGDGPFTFLQLDRDAFRLTSALPVYLNVGEFPIPATQPATQPALRRE